MHPFESSSVLWLVDTHCQYQFFQRGCLKSGFGPNCQFDRYYLYRTELWLRLQKCHIIKIEINWREWRYGENGVVMNRNTYRMSIIKYEYMRVSTCLKGSLVETSAHSINTNNSLQCKQFCFLQTSFLLILK